MLYPECPAAANSWPIQNDSSKKAHGQINSRSVVRELFLRLFRQVCGNDAFFRKKSTLAAFAAASQWIFSVYIKGEKQNFFSAPGAVDVQCYIGCITDIDCYAVESLAVIFFAENLHAVGSYMIALYQRRRRCKGFICQPVI